MTQSSDAAARVPGAGTILQIDPRGWPNYAPAAGVAGARAAQARAGGGGLATMAGPIAVIPIAGPLSAGGYYWNGSDTNAVASAVRQAAASAGVSGILLAIDSPGGSVFGMDELATAIAAAAAAKPVHAWGETIVASAAYWAASQTSRFTTLRSTVVGSLGTVMALADTSKLAANAGVDVKLYSTGQHKGAGTFGTPITAAHGREFQRSVNDFNALFREGVATGRALSPKTLDALWDGRVWLGSEARGLGLVDAIGTFDEALAGVEAATKARSPAGSGRAASATAAAHAGPAWDAPDGRGRLTVAAANQQAQREWRDNANDCRSAFSSERAYVGYRAGILGGTLSPLVCRGRG